MSLLVSSLSFDLSCLRDPTSSYATTGIALWVIEALKSLHHIEVEAPLAEPKYLSSIHSYLPFLQNGKEGKNTWYNDVGKKEKDKGEMGK